MRATASFIYSSDPPQKEYRNKCEFLISVGADGQDKTIGFRLGKYKGGSCAVVGPAESCHVSAEAKRVVDEFQRFIRYARKTSSHYIFSVISESETVRYGIQQEEAQASIECLYIEIPSQKPDVILQAVDFTFSSSASHYYHHYETKELERFNK